MIRIHREGYSTLFFIGVALILLNLLFFFIFPGKIIKDITLLISITLYLLLLYFFRAPKRKLRISDKSVISPADGKVVSIEKVHEDEYFKKPKIRVSIFLSVFNIHSNRYPISGKVEYAKYHPGKYLVAFHPKSSTPKRKNNDCSHS